MCLLLTCDLTPVDAGAVRPCRHANRRRAARCRDGGWVFCRAPIRARSTETQGNFKPPHDQPGQLKSVSVFFQTPGNGPFFFFCVFCGGKLIQAIPPTWGTATECYVWSLSVRAWERKRVECNTPGTQMGIRTWRSAIADLKPTPPGAPATSRITTISTMVKTLMAVKSMMAVQVTAMAISTVPTAPANDASYIDGHHDDNQHGDYDDRNDY